MKESVRRSGVSFSSFSVDDDAERLEELDGEIVVEEEGANVLVLLVQTLVLQRRLSGVRKRKKKRKRGREEEEEKG